LTLHEEVEETLESGLQVFSELEAEFIDLRTQLQSTEEHVRRRTDANCVSVLDIIECLLVPVVVAPLGYLP
jgi:hypothetical protein